MIYKARGDLSTAEEYFLRCLSLYNQLGGQSRSTEVFMNLGLVAHDQKNYSTALTYFKQGIAIAEERNDREGTATYLEKLGRVAISQQDYVSGLNYCKRSYAIALDLGALRLQTDGCECLYTIYKAMGKGDDALTYYELLNKAKEAMNAEETAKKLQQMEFSKAMLKDSIEKAEKDKLVLEAHQEEVRQKNKTRDMLAGGGILLLLLAGGIYSRLRYTRKAKAIIEKEKDRSENLLLNILPEEIARELKEKGRADARDFDMVSILFTDFKGFTEQSAKLSAAELVAEINHCFKAFDGIMEKYGIEKIKTIGDAYMAAGGLPVPSDESVKNTVLSALEMQQFIVARKAQHEVQGKPFFEMRVGVHTGPVVAGIVGVKKFQYDVWGDTVNTASRMESKSEVGKVNISERTYELLKGDPDFIFESRGKIEAKGKGEMDMYFVSKA
jgi:class 3 adenylate cyclase